ncbi:hypothetical protein [Actinoplanes sp. NPDC051859]|uniref:hypothetical protein n=1 Tax=Actinoplanes sp. NPDC051859 TaxID=3363909 RepID=UPI0037BA7A11
MDIAGHPVTFWIELDISPTPPGMDELGTILRQLHSATVDLRLPALDPWGHTPDRIQQAPIEERQRRILGNVLAVLRDQWAAVTFTLGDGLLHGDAHLGELTRGQPFRCPRLREPFVASHLDLRLD